MDLYLCTTLLDDPPSLLSHLLLGVAARVRGRAGGGSQRHSSSKAALKQRMKSASGEGLFFFFLTMYKRDRESYCCGCNEWERRDNITRGAQVPDES